MRVALRSVLGLFCCAATVLGGGAGVGGFATVALAQGVLTADGSGGSSFFANPLVVQGSPEEGAQLLNARRARLASPEAVTARELSRTAFEHLGAAGAAKLAREAFPAVIDQTDGGTPPLRSGEKIVRYLSDNAAQLSLPGGKHAVLESLGPIATRSSPGHFTPVNLALTDAGGSFVPVNSTAPIHIPKRLSGGVALPGSGVTVTPVDSHGAALGGSQGTQDGNGVLYANTSTDADTLVKPTTSGFEIDAVLRSVDSPSTLYLRVSMPAGAHLHRNGRSGVVSVVESGKDIARILPPTALDAVGTPVAVSMRVAGDLLVLDVRDTGSGYQFPVEVDPAVDKTLNSTGGHPSKWFFCTGVGETTVGCKGENGAIGHFATSGWYEGGALVDDGGGNYKSPEFAEFIYTTNGESHIHSATLSTEEQNNLNEGTGAESNIESFTQIGSTTASNEAYKLLSKSENGSDETPLTVKDGSSGLENSVVYKQYAYNEGQHFTDVLKTASVTIEQAESVKPTITLNTTEEHLLGGEFINVLDGENKWFGPYSGAVGFSFKEKGIGVAKMHATVETVGSGKPVLIYEKNPIEESFKCSGVQCPDESPEAFSYNKEKPLPPNGVDTLKVYAESAANTKGEASATIHIDTEEPHNLKLLGLPSSGQINEQPYALKAEATDGSGTTSSSGIRSIKFDMDGREVLGSKSGSCTPGPCSTTGEITISGEHFGAGTHTIKVVATDNAGNVANGEEYTVTVRHAGALPVGPGSVNPISGALKLGGSNVSIGGGNGALSVSRSYDSRQLTQGENGPLGPQWRLNVSGAQELETLPEAGGVVLIAADGSSTTFRSDGKGGFIAPAGDQNLALSTEKTGETITAYVLKDPALGTTVKYTQPSGSTSSSPWVISSSEGALSKTNGEQETVTWERAEVEGKKIDEPKIAKAPAPAGVNCATMVKGCRWLEFTYGTSATLPGEAPSEWKSYKGRLEKISFRAYNPATKTIPTTAVAEYAYDKQGRLRAEWDPRISPALKTTYGYDAENHVVAVNPPGQESALVHYGTTASDPGAGRLLSVTRLPAGSTTSVKEQDEKSAPVNTAAPTLSSTSPVVGTTLEVSGNGTWSNSPLAYYYAWEECYTHESKETCAPIAGAANKSYTPQARDAGYTLKAQVTAVNAAGATVAPTAASSAIALTAPSWLRTFGAAGSGEKELNHPIQDAVDAQGNVWLTNGYGNNVQKYSSTGTWLATYGKEGSEKGKVQFKEPDGIAINQTTGNVYVASYVNDRVLELKENGEFVAEFGSVGEGEGQLKGPSGVAIDPSGNVWVADNGNNRIEKFSSAGAYIGSYGTKGSGEDQFNGAEGIAISGASVYVSDLNNGRVEEFSLGGVYERQFGTKGSGSGQMLYPCEIGIDPNSGDVYVADSGNNRVNVFNSVGTYLTQFGVKGSEHGGEFIEPEGIAFNSAGDAYVVDSGSSKIEEFEPKYSKNNPLPAPPALTTSAVTTVDYNIPLEGAELQKMTKAEVETWGQTKDIPTEATAVFPPDEPMGWPAKDYKRATVSYFDELGRNVNVANPTGGVSTSEYNATNEVIRSLSADNRETALKAAKPKEESENLDTKSRYNGETTAEKEQEEKEEKENGHPVEAGVRLLESRGPQHTVKLASGSEVKARNHVLYYYDEGAPDGRVFDLATKTTDGAEYEGKEGDLRTTISSYSGQGGLGWLLRKPTSVTNASGGLNLTTTTIYDSNTGKVLETRSPAGTRNAASLTYHAQFPATGLSGSVAIDRKGNLWVTTSGGFAEYSTSGTKLLSGGAGATRGIAIGPNNTVWVDKIGPAKVEEYGEKGEFIKSFGKEGTGQGELKYPTGIAFGVGGTVLIADQVNERIKEFSEGGTFLSEFGKNGNGSGEFDALKAVAVDALGNIWVGNRGGKAEEEERLEEFNASGEYLREINASEGLEIEAKYLTIDANGHLWATGGGSHGRVLEFSPSGEYLGSLGSTGSGNGQLKNAAGVAVDAQGNVWVVDSGNSRLEQFTAPSGYLTKEYRSQTYVGLEHPQQIALDAKGDVWVINSGEVGTLSEYGPGGSFLKTVKVPGGLTEPDGLAIDRHGNIWIADTNTHGGGPLEGVVEITPSGEWLREINRGDGGIKLHDPIAVATDDEGNVWVLDEGGRVVEKFTEKGVWLSRTGGGGTGSMGLTIDSKGDVWVANTPESKLEEYGPAGNFLRSVGKEGTGNGELKHPVGIESGDPAGDIWVSDAGNHRIEEFNANGEYVTQFGIKGIGAGQFEAPSGVAVGNSGQVWAADSTNSTLQLWPSMETNGADSAHDSETVYYTAAANGTVPSCGEHAEWAGLSCQSKPAAQPGTTGLPNLPVVTDTYNMWDEPEKVEEKFEAIGTYPATTRTKKMVYDTAGRLSTNEETSTIDTSLPKVTDKYSSETGAMVEQSTTVGEITKTIKSTYNTLAQLTEYTDADANKSTYVYDIDGRVKEMKGGLKETSEKEAKQTYTYSTTSGELEELVDSDAKTFKAAYDVEGNMTSETYPNAMKAKYTLNATGEKTAIEYEKTAHCAGTCPEIWFKETVAPSAHGEARVRTSSLAKEEYTYDEAGRLTKANETLTGKGCKTRIYAYNEDSARTSLISRESATETCATSGGTTESHSYDTADRLTDTGVSYEAFGNQTKVPAADAGGSEITATFYVDNQTRSQTQGTKTLTYSTDPEGRTREIVTKEGTESTAINHFAGAGEAISWVGEGASWTRNIPGIDGTLTAIEKKGEEAKPILQLHDLQGNIVATAELSETETKLRSGSYNPTEFGVPVNGTPPKFSWLGALGQATELASGASASGGSDYVSQLGATMQTQGIVPPGAAPNGTYINPYVNKMTAAALAVSAATSKEAMGRAATRQREAQEQFERDHPVTPPGAVPSPSSPIGGSGDEEGGGGARIAGVPVCHVKWGMYEAKPGVMWAAGEFTCTHHMAAFELQLCIFAKYPGQSSYNREYCGGPGEKGGIFEDSNGGGMLLTMTCATGLIYTAWVWGREFSSFDEHAFPNSSIYSSHHASTTCNGQSPGEWQEQWEFISP